MNIIIYNIGVSWEISINSIKTKSYRRDCFDVLHIRNSPLFITPLQTWQFVLLKQRDSWYVSSMDFIKKGSTLSRTILNQLLITTALRNTPIVD